MKKHLAPTPRSPRWRWALSLPALLGILLLLGGLQGLRACHSAGFSSASVYTSLHTLSDQLRADWDALHAPFFAKLDAADATAADAAAEELLRTYWEATLPGAGAGADRLLAEAGEARRSLLWQALNLANRTSGPRLSSARRRELLAEAAGDPDALRLQLLRALPDAGADLPASAQNLVSGLSGQDRALLLLQAFFTTWQDSRLDSDEVNSLRRATSEDTALLLSAWSQILLSPPGSLQALLFSHARLAVLLGALLLLDALLLLLLIRADGTARPDPKWLIILAIVDFLLVFQLLPLADLVIRAFTPSGSFSLETFRRLLQDETGLNQAAIGNTFLASLAAMVLGTLIAFPLAFLVGRTDLPGRRLFRFLIILTYMVPPYVGAMAWQRLANPNVGVLNRLLRALPGISGDSGPLNIYTLPGLIWVLTTFYYPYAFITLSRAMEKMDPSLEDASRISGASPLKTLFRITLPLTMPSLIAGALLVFVCAASCYGIPSIIGTPGRVYTVTTRIVEYVALGQQRLSDATGMSVLLMAASLLLLFLSDLLLSRRQYITVSGKSVRPNPVSLGRLRLPLTCAVALFTVMVVLLPFATILTTSLKVDLGKSLFAPGNFTLANWQTALLAPETLSCLKNSLLYSAVAATVGIVVSVSLSYLTQRTRLRGRQLPSFLITLGSGTPSVVIALSLIMTMKGSFGIHLYNTAAILIIAYLIKYLMMGTRTVGAAMSQVHVSLEESSQISGASWLVTMRRVTVPLILPSIAAGWFLIFIPCFYELSMTTLLYANSTKTIGFQLFEYWTYTSQNVGSALACGILFIVVALNLLLGRLTKGEFSL